MTTTQNVHPQEGEKVQLAALAELVGFPTAVIKKELLLDTDTIEMGDLRKAMMVYLNENFSQLELS